MQLMLQFLRNQVVVLFYQIVWDIVPLFGKSCLYILKMQIIYHIFP